MKYYFDTSALVKRYHKEKGTVIVDDIIDGEGEIYVSTLGIVEMTSVFMRLKISGALNEKKYKRITEIFFSDVESRYIPVPFSDEHIVAAIQLIEKHNLRTLDSLHLAIAIDIDSNRDCIFVSADKKLLEAAKKEGFKIINPESDIPIN